MAAYEGINLSIQYILYLDIKTARIAFGSSVPREI